MKKRQPLCDFYGVPEEKRQDDICASTHHDIRTEDMIEQRVYDWFVKNGVVNQGELLLISEATLYVEQDAPSHSVPQYIKKFISEHQLPK